MRPRYPVEQYGGEAEGGDDGENDGGAGGENGIGADGGDGGVAGQDSNEDADGNRDHVEVIIPMHMLNVDPNGGNDVGDAYDANNNRQPPPNYGQFLCIPT